ncbi:Periplasmic thiol:disulfide interchange protein DsbA [Roseibacterium elongatum DSM 19469]|uniref:Periplasmic thiol:disulfide interchange protein DsbA n=1 Tax=Roseicyclus elongatus DSM 19469 TaxID=1294273 RepID=W8RQD3_9RHOB|nr:DsbA family protein [Roseibacterium elongatum]AHM03278.1 Periplasmic thiol:disulfide interchange protein DsbA [Roseibacterium elongatum DSM 19469]
MTIDRRTLLIAGAGAGALGLGGYSLLQGPKTPAPLLPMGMAHAQTAADGAAPEVLDMALGAEDAPVTLYEYASFTCPHCATFHSNVKPRLIEDYIEPGLVRFIYREVYFDRPGLWAGMVARCGGEMRYFGIVDLIYERQRDWVQGSPADMVESLRAIGRTAGLTNDELDACLTDADMARAMLASYEANMEVHPIEGTPAVVINDEVLGNMSYEDLSGLLDAALEEAQADG